MSKLNTIMRRVWACGLGAWLLGCGLAMAQNKIAPNEYPELQGQFLGLKLQRRSQAEAVQARRYSDRLIVQLSDAQLHQAPWVELQQVFANLAQQANLEFEPLFKLGRRFMVVKLTNVRHDSDVLAALSRLQSTPGVQSVEADLLLVRKSRTLYNDTRWPELFDFFNATATRQAASADSGADYYLPDYVGLAQQADMLPLQNVTVAVIDSGLTTGLTDLNSGNIDHAVTILNDQFSLGALEMTPDIDTGGFHGTEVAGVLFAERQNNTELAGLIPQAKRVILKVFADGATTASAVGVSAAIRYAVNRHDRSRIAQDNPFPAQVINMSLGGFFGSLDSGGAAVCPQFFQDAIDEALNAGALVVAAAGNESLDELNTPANCNGVVSVGAANSFGKRSNYSNFTPQLVTSTYGGDQIVGSFLPVLSTETDRFSEGTSLSTPLVAAALAVGKAIRPTLSPSEAIEAIRATSLPFVSTDTVCNGSVSCGALFDPMAFLTRVGELNQGDGPAKPVVTQTDIFTSGVATSVQNATIERVSAINGQPSGGASVAVASSDQLVVSVTYEGQYEVKFSGVAVVQSNRFELQSIALAQFKVRLERLANGQVQTGSIVQVQATQLPPSNPQNNPTGQSAGGASGGGGGLVGLWGLLGLLSLLALNRSRRAA